MDANREESYVGIEMGRGGRERWMTEREAEKEKSETHVQVYTLYKTFAMVIT